MSRCPALTCSLALLCLAGAGLADEGTPGPERLSAAEGAAVRKLADQALKERNLLKGKTYLTRIEVFLDGTRGERHAVATYYRYKGDLAILVHVALGSLKLTAVETFPHLPTSLSPEELAEAEKLARADRAVARALAPYADGPKIEVDAQMAITAVPDDPAFHHRVVRLNFRRGREYLPRAPNVDVDLTTGTVRVRPPGKGHN